MSNPMALLALLLAAASPKPTVICLAAPTVEATPGKAADAADAVRAAFAEYLAGPTITLTMLQSKLPSQTKEEAKAASCPYVLLTTVKHVHKSGGGSSLTSKMLGGAVQGSSYAAGSAISSAVGGEAGRVVGGAAQGAASPAAMSTYAGTVSAKDEITLGTRLEDAAGKALVDRTDKRKAESDGEDLLSPLVQKAADEVAVAATKR
jgi:hypothetical protein